MQIKEIVTNEETKERYAFSEVEHCDMTIPTLVSKIHALQFMLSRSKTQVEGFMRITSDILVTTCRHGTLVPAKTLLI